MLKVEMFKEKVKEKNIKKDFSIFIIITSLILSTVFIYTYILNSPANSSDLPEIKIKIEDELKYGKSIDCTFQLNSSDESGDISPIKAKIRLRGSGTGWNRMTPKKDYRIELMKSVSILGLREEDDWLLLGMYSDYPRMRTKLAFEMWRSLLQTNPTAILPKSKFVLLYLNGELEGLYLLTEKNNRKLFNLNSEQKNINSSFIFQTKFNTDLKKYDKDAWEQDWPNDYEGYYIMDEILTDLTSFIRNSKEYEFFNPINGIYSKFDKLNLIDFYIFNFFILHKDFWGKNYFLMRDIYPGKCFLIPWDFDACFGQYSWNMDDPDENPESEISTKNYLFNRLINNNSFMNDCKNRWIELRKGLWTEEFILDIISDIYEKIKEFLEVDTDIWNPGKMDEEWENDVYEYVKHLSQWISDRLEFCDLYFNNY